MENEAAAVPAEITDARLIVENGDLWLAESPERRMRVVLERASHACTRRPKLDQRRQDVFLFGLSQGLTVQEAADTVGVAFQSCYELRRRNSDFARRWDEAYEMGAAPLERMAYSIGLGQTKADMAQVRAIEIGMKHRVGALKHPRPAATRAELHNNGDGTGSFTVTIGSPSID